MSARLDGKWRDAPPELIGQIDLLVRIVKTVNLSGGSLKICDREFRVEFFAGDYAAIATLSTTRWRIDISWAVKSTINCVSGSVEALLDDIALARLAGLG